jgi:hypothetical protein
VIKVAVAGGVAIYLFCVVLAAAGFTTIVPFVVIVPILVLLVGGGNMLGGRSHGRTRAAAPPGFDPAPLSSSGPNAPVAPPRSNVEPDDPHRAGREAGSTDTVGTGSTDTSGTGPTDTAGADSTDTPRDNGGEGPGDHE